MFESPHANFILAVFVGIVVIVSVVSLIADWLRLWFENLELEKSLDRLAREREAARADLDEAFKDVAALSKRIAGLRGENDNLAGRLSAVVEDRGNYRNKLHNTITQLSEENQGLTKQVEELKSQVINLRESRKTVEALLQKRFDEITEEREEFRQVSAALKKALNNERSKLAELSDRHQKLLTAKGWYPMSTAERGRS